LNRPAVRGLTGTGTREPIGAPVTRNCLRRHRLRGSRRTLRALRVLWLTPCSLRRNNSQLPAV